eukprot:Skav203229  [mRNA]  locus=scaffold2292:367506:371770:+ [translate_table: standard]
MSTSLHLCAAEAWRPEAVGREVTGRSKREAFQVFTGGALVERSPVRRKAEGLANTMDLADLEAGLVMD